MKRLFQVIKKVWSSELNLGDEKGLSGTLNNLGNLYRAMGERDKAFESFIKSIDIKKKLGDEKGAANTYLNLGNWMARESDFDNAILYYSRFKAIQEELKDTLGLSMVIFNTGNIFYEKGVYNKALQNYLESLSLLENFKASNQRMIASRYFSIGNIYERMDYPDLAIENYKASLVIYEKFQDLESMGDLFLNIGKVFENLQEPDSALAYYKNSISKYQNLNNPELLAGVYQNIGVIYNQESSPEFALDYLLKAENIFEEVGHRNLANVYNSIGASYFYLRDYTRALSYYKESLKKATKDNYLEVQRRATFGLAETYGVLKDYENAYKYQIEYDIYNDSLFNLEKTEAIQELITEYETEKVNAENKLLLSQQIQNEAIIERRNAENRTLLTGMLALVGAVVGIIVWIVYSNRKKRIIAAQKESLYQTKIDSLLDRQQLESISAMLEGQEKERKRLAAELHDRLGSILSLVKMYFSSLDVDIKEAKPELHASFTEGNQFLDDAFKEVRLLIKEMQEGVGSSEGLERDLKKLLDKISKLGIEIKSRIELDKKLDTIVEMNIYRVIQEALSNSLKYSKAELIELVLSDTDQLKVMIKDNGVGFDPEKIPQKEDGDASYGVGNMENRVKLLGGEFDLITKEGEGVTIDIQIPLVDNEGIWGRQS
ncbi:MAG: ATP-binding protein [Balneolaceae bacterium]